MSMFSEIGQWAGDVLGTGAHIAGEVMEHNPSTLARSLPIIGNIIHGVQFAQHAGRAISHYGDGTNESSDLAGEAVLDAVGMIPLLGNVVGAGRGIYDGVQLGRRAHGASEEEAPLLGHHILADPDPHRAERLSSPNYQPPF